MAITIQNTLDVTISGIVELPNGSVWAVIQEDTGVSTNNLRVYKNLLSTPALSETVSSSTIHGTGETDLEAILPTSDGNFYVCCSAVTTTSTRNYAYALFNTTTETFGTWTEAIGVTEPHSFAGSAWDIDSSGVLHCFAVDSIKHHGTAYYQVVWNSNSGGSWGTPEVVCGTPDINYRGALRIVTDSNDVPHCSYKELFLDRQVYNNRIGGTWGTEDLGSVDSIVGLGMTRGGTTPRFLGSNGDATPPLTMYEGTDLDTYSYTGYSAGGGNGFLVMPNNGSGARVIVYPGNTGVPSYIDAIYNDGSGWIALTRGDPDQWDVFRIENYVTSHSANHHTNNWVNVIVEDRSETTTAWFRIYFPGGSTPPSMMFNRRVRFIEGPR